MIDFIVDSKFLISALAVALILSVRWLFARLLRQNRQREIESTNRLINSLNNITTLLIALTLVMVWITEIRYVALSVATFIVALVIASREFIQCILGSLFLTTTRLFHVGDWIKVGDQYGEVVRSDWLSTTLLEIDMKSIRYSYTGRSLVVPNNRFVTDISTNLNFMRRYVEHTFEIVREPDQVCLRDAREFLNGVARKYCESFRDVALRYNSLIQKRLGIDLAGPEVDARLSTTDLGKSRFTVTIFCPTAEALNIEQKVIGDFLDYWQAAKSMLDAKEHATP
ncbi:MAG: mechanosensitive ion channel family protein [bacterium]